MAPKISIEKHREDIRKFKSIEESFILYAAILKQILEKAVDIYAPLGVVQARAKKIESFSEKIIRKDKYKDPLTDMTDLCGARVITHFSRQVHVICKFIEENFEIDHENSLDLKSKLSTSEFGYRSIHYIVIPRKAKILDVEIPEEIRTLKAEIQVRTFHEHIWADILHDRIYKSAINVTDEWRRESARLAAMLEESDNSFAGISDTIDQLSVNYQATPSPETLNNEIEILKVLIRLNSSIDKKDAQSRLKLARIYNLMGEWENTTELLQPALEVSTLEESIKGGIFREFGYALCHLKTDSSEGLTYIQKSGSIFRDMPSKNRELSLTYNYLAIVSKGDSLEYADLAHKLSPENPYYFTQLLVERFSPVESPTHIELDLISSKMDKVLYDFHEHISLGIEVPDAYLNTGKIQFLKSDFSESYTTYITFFKMVMNNELPISKDRIKRELKDIGKIAKLNTFNAFNIKGILHLLLWKKYEEVSSKEFLGQFKNKEKSLSGDIMILCGRSVKLEDSEYDEYQRYLEEALRDFSGTVISGGTTTGIPGLLGTFTSMKRKNNTKKYMCLGYLPSGEEADRDYDSHVQTRSNEFSVLEPLSYWIDLLFNDIDPASVLVVGIDGGNISSFEYKLALTLGAKVCLIGKLGGAAQQVSSDPAWNKLPNCFNIPADPLTLWAMVNNNRPGMLTPEEVNKLAHKVHEFYARKRIAELNPEKETDINKYRVIMNWDKLAPSLQNSNLKQVAFMEHIFTRGGLTLRKSEHPEKFILFETYPTLDMMARLEHARWNAERIMDGWKYAPVKDVLTKKSNCLVPWDELDEKTKSFDYDPIKDFPGLLLEIGYEVIEKR